MLIDEPIYNAVLENVDLNNVSGISNNYIKNIRAENIKYDAEAMKITDSSIDAYATNEIERL